MVKTPEPDRSRGTLQHNLEWWRQQATYLSTGSMYGHLDSVVAHLAGEFIIVVMRGWLFHSEHPIRKLSFPQFSVDETIVLKNWERLDVAAAFPSLSRAKNSGFAVVTRIPRSVLKNLSSQLAFEVSLADMSKCSGVFDKRRWAFWPEVPWEKGEKENVFRVDPWQSEEIDRIFVYEAEQREDALKDLSSIGLSPENEILLVCYDASGKSSDIRDNISLRSKIELKIFLTQALSCTKNINVYGKDLKADILSLEDVLISFAENVSFQFL